MIFKNKSEQGKYWEHPLVLSISYEEQERIMREQIETAAEAERIRRQVSMERQRVEEEMRRTIIAKSPVVVRRKRENAYVSPTNISSSPDFSPSYNFGSDSGSSYSSDSSSSGSNDSFSGGGGDFGGGGSDSSW